MKALVRIGDLGADAKRSAFKITILLYVVLGVSFSLWNKPNWISAAEVAVLGAVLLLSTMDSTKRKQWLIWALLALVGTIYLYDGRDRVGESTHHVSWFEIVAALITAYAAFELISTLLQIWRAPIRATPDSRLK